MIYLAQPIDKAGENGQLKQLIEACNNALFAQFMPAYRPGVAYLNGKVDPTAIVTINSTALEICDGVLAILPDGVSSVGVPMEIGKALADGKPVALLGGADSVQLAGAQGRLRRFDIRLSCNIQEAATDAVFWLSNQLSEQVFCSSEEAEETARQLALGAKVIKWTGPKAMEPIRSFGGDAGFDLVVEHGVNIRPGGFFDVPCGINVELPERVWAMITGRSSTLRKRQVLVHTGIIDQGYRGPLFAGCWNMGERMVTIHAGERIAQLIPFPQIAADLALEQVNELGPSDRGEQGFGSTGGFKDPRLKVNIGLNRPRPLGADPLG